MMFSLSKIHIMEEKNTIIPHIENIPAAPLEIDLRRRSKDISSFTLDEDFGGTGLLSPVKKAVRMLVPMIAPKMSIPIFTSEKSLTPAIPQIKAGPAR